MVHKTSAAEWRADQKVMWSDEEGWTEGLVGKRSAAAPDPDLSVYVSAILESGSSVSEVDADLSEMLRAAGYMEE